MPTLLKAPLSKDLFWILIPSIFITLAAIAFNWDAKIAEGIYNPESQWAFLVRQYSNIPGAVLSVAFLVFILLPWRKKFPALRRTSLLWLFTTIIGGGLFVHVILKEYTDRPRPRETVILGGDLAYAHAFKPSAALKGKSFPSGHTAMAAAFIIPFFTLRRRHKKTAIAVAVFAAAYTTMVSLSRMTLGAHFLTDCLWGFTVVAAFAAIGSRFIKEETDLKVRYIIAIFAFLIFCLAWFNKFKLSLTFSTENASEITRINLPCELNNIRTTANENMDLEITLKGYGAPLSWLSLKEKNGEIYLTDSFGIYRNLTCEVESITLPTSHKLLIEALK